MKHIFLCGWVAMLFIISACAEPIRAPDSEIKKYMVPNDGPTSIVLLSMVNKISGNSEHTGLLINASQKVLLDPAGTFHHSQAPERNDLFYGITPRVMNVYYRYHARKDYYVRVQTLNVTPATAEQVFKAAREVGATPKFFCGTTISKVLRAVPQFKDFPNSINPQKIARNFAKLPSVVETRIYDSDIGKNLVQ